MLVRACRPVCRLAATGAPHLKCAARPVVIRVRLLTTEPELPPVGQPVEPIVAAPDAPPPETDKTTTGRTPRARTTRTTRSSSDPVILPENVDILWSTYESDIPSEILPPPAILSDALDKLNLSLHPHNQRKATPPNANPAFEPTLCLYCPMEGGGYILDATVKELARSTGADVVLLDCAHLAASEWGHFGSANPLQLPVNPLHVPSLSTLREANEPQTVNEPEPAVDDGSEDSDLSDPSRMFREQISMIITSSGGGPVQVKSRAAKPPPKSPLQRFFDAVVNISADGVEPVPGRPRIIYVQDFTLGADSAPLWYPALLQSVQERRRGSGPLTRNIVQNPVTIIFGSTPLIQPASFRPSSSASPQSLLHLLARRSTPSPQPMPAISSGSAPKFPTAADYNESEAAEKAREKRLHSRLRKWDRDDGSLNRSEIPSIPTAPSDSHNAGSDRVVLNFPQILRPPPPSQTLPWFKTGVIVPSVRSPSAEKAERIRRRQEINELCFRMAIGSMGGRLESSSLVDLAAFHSSTAPVILAEESGSSSSESDSPPSASPDSALAADASLLSEQTASVDNPSDDNSLPPSNEASKDRHDTLSNALSEWETQIEEWQAVRKIADRALGSVLTQSFRTPAFTMDYFTTSTLVPWEAVVDSWASFKSGKDVRKSWIKETVSQLRSQYNTKEFEDDDVEEDEEEEEGDPVVEKIKNDPDLDTHEQRLLGCIVNTELMPTSFSQVHLPSHTIDSIRTVVSLPLLHPQAFQQGILKEYGISGCLLFGPPGTGKTLLVRALAREAGCRMLVVSPADIMDMYVGEGEKLVKAVFNLARKLSPCVVFLDEIDALFGSRVSRDMSGSASAHRGIITEFMQEMDGLNSSREDAVIIIGATNRPGDLDDAILRRLPRRLLVDLPGEKEREAILRIHLRDEELAPDVDIALLSRMTDGFSGSDLKHLCVSAALAAVKDTHPVPWLESSRSAAKTEATEGTKEPAETSTPISEETEASDECKSRSTSSPSKQPSSEFESPTVTPGATSSIDTDLNASPTSSQQAAQDMPSTNPTLAPEPATPIEKNEGVSPTSLEGSSADAQPSTLIDPVEEEPRAESTDDTPPPKRVLTVLHFNQALQEITPSSSENLGSLAELRKWNAEFGEGKKDRKRKQVWGKDRFGFTREEIGRPDARVVVPSPTTSSSPPTMPPQ